MQYSDKPKLSVRLQTYNHAKYIKRALDGILMQITDFAFEVVIGDDFSTDNTLNIIRSYKDTNTVNIRILKRTIGGEYYLNRKKHGRLYNFYDIIKNCKGSYIALLDGDDYWIDPSKLQKQVNFLESNHNYSLCFHNALIMWDDKHRPPKYFCSKNQNLKSDITDVINNWFVPTSSIVFRANLNNNCLPSWFLKIYNGDLALQLIVAEHGDFYYIDEVMSIYRKSIDGLSAINSSLYITEKQIETLSLYKMNRIINNDNNTSTLIDLRIRNLHKRHRRLNSNLHKLFLRHFNLSNINKILYNVKLYISFEE